MYVTFTLLLLLIKIKTHIIIHPVVRVDGDLIKDKGFLWPVIDVVEIHLAIDLGGSLPLKVYGVLVLTIHVSDDGRIRGV